MLSETRCWIIGSREARGLGVVIDNLYRAAFGLGVAINEFCHIALGLGMRIRGLRAGNRGGVELALFR